MQLFNVERSNSLWYSHTAEYFVGIKNKTTAKQGISPYSIVLKSTGKYIHIWAEKRKDE